MFRSNPGKPSDEWEFIAQRGPKGALALCGIAVALVFVIWFLFYFLAFLPRGHLQ